MDSREIFSPRLLNDDDMINAAINGLNVNKENVLIIRTPDEWEKRNNETVVFESVGLLDEGDTEEYIGYYYYNIYLYEDNLLGKLKNLEKEFDTKVIVTI